MTKRRLIKQEDNLLRLTQETPDRIIRKVEEFKPLTEKQAKYVSSILNNKLTFGLGPAGTGKTYVVAAMAARQFLEVKNFKLIITRPAVEAGRSLGYLPGELEEKYEPFIRPFMDVMERTLGSGQANYNLKRKLIEPIPLNYMRGMTFEDDCWVVLDEAQNVTKTEMKMFLTRIGENCRVIVNGDPEQQDIGGESALLDAVKRCKSIYDVGVVKFGFDDIVRSGLAQDIVQAYSVYNERHDKQQNGFIHPPEFLTNGKSHKGLSGS